MTDISTLGRHGQPNLRNYSNTEIEDPDYAQAKTEDARNYYCEVIP